MGDRHIPRWSVTVQFRTDDGPVEAHYAIEELSELHNLIELGPDWNTIEKIEVTLARTTGRLTLEQAHG
jgi:hypothetical protein